MSGIRYKKPRTKFIFGYSATMEKILELTANGLKRGEIASQVSLGESQISKALRIYKTAQGKTPDGGIAEIQSKAIELVKKLDADDIALHYANEELIACILEVKGKRPTYTRTAGTENPEQQLATYQRAVSALEGICLGLDKLPDVVHGGIIPQQRKDVEMRLAACRRIIEQRINILRKGQENNG